MEILYAPWRTCYTKSLIKNDSLPEECVFCVQFSQPNDEQFFILRRFKHNIIMLNFYPYNGGHLLVLPLQHTPHLHELVPEARNELMQLITVSTDILYTALHAQGVNVGFNLGKAAGAGLPSHVHGHILPRWFGDTNFLPTLGHIKQISTDLTSIYTQLKPLFNAVTL